MARNIGTAVGGRSVRCGDGLRTTRERREFVAYPEDSSVCVWYSDVPWRCETPVHSAVEIVLTTDGTVEYTAGGASWSVREGDVLIIPPDMPHSLSMGENSGRQLFLFEPDLLMSMRDAMNLPGLFSRVFWLHDGSETHARIREMLLRIVSLQKDQEVMWNTMCYSCILRIYAELGRRYLPGARRKKGIRGAADQDVIASSMAYINEHYMENLTLDEVANFAGFNRYYFSRSFKKQTGYFFKDYLCRKRLEAAVGLLVRTKASIREVALQSGFGSVATFNRVFREKNGSTPTRYRANYGVR